MTDGVAKKGGREVTVTLITGANKGLGYETARRLIAEGHTVYMGAREFRARRRGRVRARR